MNDIDRSKLSSARYEDEMYPNAKLTSLTIDLFEQNLIEMKQFLGGGQFESENEGWRFLLATGYSYLRGLERIKPAGTDQADLTPADENLRRLIEIEAMYAVLKQRAYVWMKDHQIMELQNSALHIQADGYRGKASELLDENQALKKELTQLREQVKRLSPRTPVSISSVSPLSIWSRVKRWLRRGG
jgi:hypothetical protein